MGMISGAVAAKVHRVVALGQSFWIFNRDGLPGPATIHRDVVIAAGAWSGWPSGLKRSRDNVVRIRRVDGYRNFGGIDCVGVVNSYHLLSDLSMGSQAS